VTLSWDMPTRNADGSALTDLTGYAIYYGTSADNLTMRQVVSGSNSLSTTLSNLNLSNSLTYYFAITAVSSIGGESARSPVVSRSF
jgi:hypothetical protein